MTLIDLPGNKGHVFAVNPHKVTAVQFYEGEIAGKTGKHPLSVVWVERHNLFVCAWPLEQTLAHLNEVRQKDADVFAAGFAAGASSEWATDLPDDPASWVSRAWSKYQEGEG